MDNAYALGYVAGISDGLANEGVQAGEPTLLGLKKAKGGA